MLLHVLTLAVLLLLVAVLGRSVSTTTDVGWLADETASWSRCCLCDNDWLLVHLHLLHVHHSSSLSSACCCNHNCEENQANEEPKEESTPHGACVITASVVAVVVGAVCATAIKVLLGIVVFKATESHIFYLFL